MGKKTLILGATNNPDRIAYLAAHRLKGYGHEIVPVGIKKGEVAGVRIINDKSPVEGIDTVTMYIGPAHQAEWYEYILALKPKRIIFNPGTENDTLVALAQAKGIETDEACTLVLLGAGAY